MEVGQLAIAARDADIDLVSAGGGAHLHPPVQLAIDAAGDPGREWDVTPDLGQARLSLESSQGPHLGHFGAMETVVQHARGGPDGQSEHADPDQGVDQDGTAVARARTFIAASVQGRSIRPRPAAAQGGRS